MDRSSQIEAFNRYIQVSRETITSLKEYEKLLIKRNKTLNLIGKSTVNQIWLRHFLDSAQLIDFIDKNNDTIVDLGSGAGFPGMIIAILVKDRKIPIKIKLIEKSPKKSSFLREIIKSLKLKAEVLNKNVFQLPSKLQEDLIIARAFKPLNGVLQFIDQKTENWKKIFLFLGKNGENELSQASKSWNIKYKRRMSITSSDSIVIEINRLEKK